jgi:hypothetical protein
MLMKRQIVTGREVNHALENTQELTAEALGGGAERRQYTRRSAHWRVTITTRKKQVVQCKTKDISERGVSIASPVDFKRDALVLIEIHAYYGGKNMEFKVLGEIKHTSIAPDGRSYSLGVFIKDAPDKAFAFFKKFAEGQI